MIRSGQVLNSSGISSMSPVSASFRKRIKTEWVMLTTMSNRDFFSNQEDVDLNYSIWPTRLRFYPCPPYLQVSRRFDQNWMSYADDNIKQMIFINQGDVTLNRWSNLANFQTCSRFCLCPPIFKCQEVLIKIERVVVMTNSIRGFCSNQGDAVLRLMIHLGQILNFPRFNPCPPYLQVSGRSNQNWMRYAGECQTEAFSAIKGT